jgi:putative restriction endonuclease
VLEFDRPLFKRLSHNDTGAARGHQGGIVVPKELDSYFPQLSRKVSSESPTVDQQVRAILMLGLGYLGAVETRYQFQTWGGTRSPERRLTGNLGALRNLASGGDILTIERSLIDERLYRLTLYRRASAEFAGISALAGGRNWGALYPQDGPVRETEIEREVDRQTQQEVAPFHVFDKMAPLIETRTTRIARSQAFKRKLLPLYDFTCSVCGQSHVTPDGAIEAEAAHIVPRSLKGSDDSRNGLALCRSHHWAFDRGLFSLSDKMTVLVAEPAAKESRNSHLADFHEKPLRLPKDSRLNPALEALAWHRMNVMLA